MAAEERLLFGEWVRKQRMKQELTLDQLATKAGLSKTHLWKIERMLGDVTFHTADKLTNALGTPLWQVVKQFPEEF